MKYRVVWLNALMLWLAMISTSAMLKKCKKDAECNGISQTCHSSFKICVPNNSSLITLVTGSQNAICKNCLADEYCHPIFKLCLKPLTLPSTMRTEKPTAADCKHNRDCAKNKYCHKIFRKCLDIPVIPTTSTTKPSTQSCRNDSTCGKNRYCHVMFKMCLERLTAFPNVTTPPVKYNCTGDKDCHPGQYCVSVTNTCQQVKKLSGSGLPSPPTKHSRCRTDLDCSRNENSHQHLPVATTKKRRLKCSNGVHCSPRRRHKGLGIVALHPPSGNCSRDDDCRPGMCCLTKLGMCKRFSMRGDPCVMQPADFTCPCSANLFCKLNSKKRKLRGRRLERRLDLSRRIHRELKKRGLGIRKKYIYGKCHKISN